MKEYANNIDTKVRLSGLITYSISVYTNPDDHLSLNPKYA